MGRRTDVMRRVKQRVPLETCRLRALYAIGSRRFVKASELAVAIWPDTTFTAQGAGASVSRVLKSLEKDGLVHWSSCEIERCWGWERTRKGSEVLRSCRSYTFSA